MDRPGLRKLLEEIAAGLVQVVVVYKVDRLTRALSDFARIVDIFDSRGLSFVSVTQQFNTTTSMGRLTLNVLLSFSQFEREVTGERIRDKIAASKKKGMWMGGFVPLGYDAVDRKLIIDEEGAKTVRGLFSLYARRRSVWKMKEEADRLKLHSKSGSLFSRGHIYRILQNPIYIGEIRDRSKTYPGEHKPIIPRELWDQVQDTLEENRIKIRNGKNSKSPSLLAGLLFGKEGAGYTPSHAVKSGKRYRYYVERRPAGDEREESLGITRIPAHEIEAVVVDTLKNLFNGPDSLGAAIDLKDLSPPEIKKALRAAERIKRDIGNSESAGLREMLRDILFRVILETNRVSIEVRKGKLQTLLGMKARAGNQDVHLIRISVKLRTRGPQLKLVLDRKEEKGKPDPALVKAVIRAHEWFGRLLAGEAGSISKISKAEGVTASYVTRVMRLAFLAPEITGAILDGSHPAHLTANRLVNDRSFPIDWEEQRTHLGL